jgi:hypothetical protein
MDRIVEDIDKILQLDTNELLEEGLRSCRDLHRLIMVNRARLVIAGHFFIVLFRVVLAVVFLVAIGGLLLSLIPPRELPWRLPQMDHQETIDVGKHSALGVAKRGKALPFSIHFPQRDGVGPQLLVE